MTMVVPLGWQVVDANGAPYSGAKAYMYLTGTTTPQATYTVAALTVGLEHPNPVVADSGGRFPAVYGPTTNDYKVVLKTSADVTIATFDPVQMTGTPGAGAIGTTQITDAAVTNAKLANMATQRFKGRTTAGTGVPEDLTPDQAATILGYDYLGLANMQSGIIPYASIPLAGASAADFVLDTTNLRAVLFVLDAVVMTSDGANLLARVSVDGGSSFLATATYIHARSIADSAAGMTAAGSTGDTSVIMAGAVDSTASQNLSGVCDLIIGGAAAHATKFDFRVGYVSTAVNAARISGYGSNSTASQVNAVRFLPSTSTFASGTIYPYGIPKRT